MSTRDLICHDWHPTLRPNDGGYIPMAMDSGAALVARGPMRAGRRQGLDTELPPVPRETEPQYTPVPEEEEQDPQQEVTGPAGRLARSGRCHRDAAEQGSGRRPAWRMSRSSWMRWVRPRRPPAKSLRNPAPWTPHSIRDTRCSRGRLILTG